MHYDDGSLLGYSEFKNGLLDGLYILYDHNGDIVHHKNFKNGLPDGESLEYKNGVLLKREFYLKGILNGVKEEYFDGGEIKSREEYEFNSFNRKNGHATYYYKNGGIYQEGNYVNDEKDGVWKEYLPDGTKLSEVVEYKDGEKVSWTTYSWAGTGDIISKGSFVNGKKNGEAVINNLDSKTILKFNYKDDVMHGKFELFSYEGVLLEKGEYRGGSKNGYNQTYYANGKLKSSGMLKENVPIGEWMFNGENGQLKKISTFSDNGNEWYIKRFHENGAIREKILKLKDMQYTLRHAVYAPNGRVISDKHVDAMGKLLTSVTKLKDDPMNAQIKIQDFPD